MSIWRRYVSGCLAILVVAGVCVPAVATEVDMAALPPVVDPFRCLICHQTDPADTGSTALNSFGLDFLDNGRIWNGALAALDSDGDNCLNGVELGDVDGDGENDGGVSTLQSNPGNALDCGGATVDSRTWGELKALFDRN